MPIGAASGACSFMMPRPAESRLWSSSAVDRAEGQGGTRSEACVAGHHRQRQQEVSRRRAHGGRAGGTRSNSRVPTRISRAASESSAACDRSETPARSPRGSSTRPRSTATAGRSAAAPHRGGRTEQGHVKDQRDQRVPIYVSGEQVRCASVCGAACCERTKKRERERREARSRAGTERVGAGPAGDEPVQQADVGDRDQQQSLVQRLEKGVDGISAGQEQAEVRRKGAPRRRSSAAQQLDQHSRRRRPTAGASTYAEAERSLKCLAASCSPNVRMINDCGDRCRRRRQPRPSPVLRRSSEPESVRDPRPGAPSESM